MPEPAKKGGLGIMAVLGEPEGGSDPISAKTAALKDMFTAAKSGDWEGAAHAFQEAYDACAGLGAEEEDDDEFLEE